MTFTTQLNIIKGGSVYRIVFYKEQSGKNAGIRIGYYGHSLNGLHATYYQGGSMHHEVDRKILQTVDTLSFDKIETSLQLGFQAVPLDSTMHLIASEGVGSRVPEKIITLSYEDYPDTLAIDSHLVRQGSEKKFLNQISDSFCSAGSSHALVGLEFIKLQLFSNLKLAVILLSENKV